VEGRGCEQNASDIDDKSLLDDVVFLEETAGRNLRMQCRDHGEILLHLRRLSVLSEQVVGSVLYTVTLVGDKAPSHLRGHMMKIAGGSPGSDLYTFRLMRMVVAPMAVRSYHGDLHSTAIQQSYEFQIKTRAW